MNEERKERKKERRGDSERDIERNKKKKRQKGTDGMKKIEAWKTKNFDRREGKRVKETALNNRDSGQSKQRG